MTLRLGAILALMFCTVQIIGAAPAFVDSIHTKDAQFVEPSFNSVNEEECGAGYTCDHDGDAYGCSKISAPSGAPMVCCSGGQTIEQCNSTSSPLHPLPFCPSGGATGGGCIRVTERSKYVH